MKSRTRRLCWGLVILGIGGCGPEDSKHQLEDAFHGNEPGPTASATNSAANDMKQFVPSVGYSAEADGLFDKVITDVVDTRLIRKLDRTAEFSLAGRPGIRPLSRNARDCLLQFVERPAFRLRPEFATPGAAYAVIRCGGISYTVYEGMIVFKNETCGESYAWRSRLSDSISIAAEGDNIGAAVECAEAYFRDSN